MSIPDVERHHAHSAGVSPLMHQPGMNVYAVTVTYGDRAGLVERMAKRLMEINVYKLIIIDNGSPEANKGRLKNLAATYPSKIKVVTLVENSGSAGGFKEALMAAQAEGDCDFIWMLDDDNLPHQHALEQLLGTYGKLNENCCLVSLRKNRLLYRKIFNPCDVKRKFNPYNSFINYSLLHGIRKKFLYSRKKLDLIPIPYAPYGGMFFHKRLLEIIGYPMDEMYLYRDDHEYSHRIVRAGLNIYLDRHSVIEDMEVSWHGRRKYRFFSRFMTVVDGDETKSYYLIRNSIYFEKKYYVTNRIEYAVNRSLYILIFFSLCILLNKRDRIKLFRRAYSDSKRMK